MQGCRSRNRTRSSKTVATIAEVEGAIAASPSKHKLGLFPRGVNNAEENPWTSAPRCRSASRLLAHRENLDCGGHRRGRPRATENCCGAADCLCATTPLFRN